MATVNLGRIKFVWQGAYSGATAYVADDVVSYNGSSYICILASTGNLPTNATYWSIMSSAGTNGTNGTDVGTTITTQGDILYRNASGLARLGAGTNGQVLTTAGAGANPSWSTVSQKLLQIQTAVATSSVTASTTVSTYHGGTLPSNFGTSFITISFTPTSASSTLVVMANAPFGIDGNALGMCNVTHNNDTIGVFMGNGYSGDGCGATITAFVASGSTSARNISFRVVGGWSGETMRLGGMRSDTLATAMTAGVFGTLTVLEIEP